MFDLNLKRLLLLGLSLQMGCTTEPEPVALPDPQVVIARVEAAVADKDAYRSALADNQRGAYHDYLDDFPDGRFRDEVTEHLAQLDNREAQATYAYEIVIQNLEAIGKARKVRTPNVGSYTPTVDQTLKKIKQSFAEQLVKFKREDARGLPNNYLDYLDKQLGNSRLYTNELSTEYQQYERKLLGGNSLVASMRKALAGPHLDRCRRAVREYAAQFRQRGQRARASLKEYRVAE